MPAFHTTSRICAPGIPPNTDSRPALTRIPTQAHERLTNGPAHYRESASIVTEHRPAVDSPLDRVDLFTVGSYLHYPRSTPSSGPILRSMASDDRPRSNAVAIGEIQHPWMLLTSAAMIVMAIALLIVSSGDFYSSGALTYGK